MGPRHPLEQVKDNGMNWADQAAKSDFERAHLKSFWNEILSKMRRTNNHLLPFDEVRNVLPMQGQYDLGMKVIPIDHIVGSVNRSNDFDRAFLPIDQHNRDRWINIDRARLQDIELPAIEVYKLDEVYFVIDGNHRVSVAREKGQAFIDAHVTELEVSEQITPEMDWNDIILEKERTQFIQVTHAGELIPDSDIRLTQVGQYQTLIEHISVHRWFMGERHRHPISMERAVVSWYTKVYLPIIKIIRKRKILQDFPGKTEADLYLWISTHQYFLAEEAGQKVPLEQAAIHFVNKYSHKPVRRICYWFRKVRRYLLHLWNEFNHTS